MAWLVPEDRESVRIPIPAGEPTVRDGNPQIMMLILSDCLDEIPWEPIGGAAAVAIADEPVSVVPDQPVLGTKPHETLSVLEGYVHRTLRQPVRGSQVFKHRG